MIKKFLKPYPLVYFLSLFFGLLLIFFILISYLKFSSGNILFGSVLVLFSFLILSSFIAWVKKIEDQGDRNNKEKKATTRSLYKGRIEC